HLGSVRSEPGSCPICGMALEPRTAQAQEEANPELSSMTRRFWITLVLPVPVLLLGMSRLIPGHIFAHLLTARYITWIELALSTPVVLWGGWPFFERGWSSIINRSPNMFTLVSIGIGTAYFYSLIATLIPGSFP